MRIVFGGLFLVSMVGRAGEPESTRTTAPPREFIRRGLFLRSAPGSAVPEVYVAGQIATVLRFEKQCDPSRTNLAPGWEGRFEPPMISGGTVVLVPIQELAPADRVPLRVAFEDGTERHFTLTSRRELADHQVNVFEDGETQQAMHWALADVRRANWRLGVENERYRREALSPDHSLAGLLATGAEDLAPFAQVRAKSLTDNAADTQIGLFKGKGKVAVVFKIRNKAQRDWRLKETSLVVADSGEPRPFALRMNPAEISPGATGTLAVVVDRSAFYSGKHPVNLTLRLLCVDGAQHGPVNLPYSLVHSKSAVKP